MRIVSILSFLNLKSFKICSLLTFISWKQDASSCLRERQFKISIAILVWRDVIGNFSGLLEQQPKKKKKNSQASQ